MVLRTVPVTWVSLDENETVQYLEESVVEFEAYTKFRWKRVLSLSGLMAGIGLSHLNASPQACIGASLSIGAALNYFIEVSSHKIVSDDGDLPQCSLPNLSVRSLRRSFLGYPLQIWRDHYGYREFVWARALSLVVVTRPTGTDYFIEAAPLENENAGLTERKFLIPIHSVRIGVKHSCLNLLADAGLWRYPRMPELRLP